MKSKSLLLVLFILLFGLGACGASATSGEVNMDAQEELTVFKYLGPWTDMDVNDADEVTIIEEQTGMPAEYSMLPVSNADEKLQLELSSNADYDAIQVSVEQYGSLVNQGALLNLRPYIEEYGPNLEQYISKEAWAAVEADDGGIYGIPRMGASEVLENQIYIRRDILEKEGYEVPKTTDDLLEVTCGLADKGYKTPWASGNQTYGDMPLRGAFGVAQAWNYDKDGNLIYIGQDDRYRDFLAFEKEMNDCGAFGNDYETITIDDAVQRFVNGDAAFFPGAYWNANALATGMDSAGKNFYEDVEIIPSVEGPEGYKLTTQASASINNLIVIPEYQEKYAVSIIKYIDALNDPEWFESVLMGKEGENYKILDDGQKYVYNPPLYNDDKPWGAYYSIGGPTQVVADSTNSGVLERADKLESGEYQKNGPEYANDYTLAINDTQREFGEQNPIAMVINVEDWSKNSLAMNNEVSDFSILYVSSQKTDEDWENLKTTMNEKYSIDTMTQELQEQVEKVEDAN